ncbi:MAG: hypothetical protein GFH27_549305n126 [Chloroflexi bacterium AL-W]|nr:hypothetical protein [Chloroflexi bacterium AL-N1]NOK69372.1 hypothetical protein [Chloroflexi bacterium AL-N10]NOK76433.1 hypothetical protein [Chloroflexi bacterium AL-N5]NOK83550.1 hypothetical protein [Chloroflexi bacterium AL-W]NOK91210.1 hypothetical protein [Chloroflexi bacterium AL-N15]
MAFLRPTLYRTTDWKVQWHRAHPYIRHHVLVFTFYAFLSVALSWPTVLHFTTGLTSGGIDAKHNLWTFWHTQQALLGQQPLFDAPFLYYPEGISLLVHGVGPLTSIFALPFWWLGPEGAYNSALLIGLTLSGYCTYLLGRGLGFSRGVALFVGIVVMSSPMCIAGLRNHVTKVFVGAIPLALLALHYTLDLNRSRWWTAATMGALLLTLLHTGYQFIFTSLAIGFFVLVALYRSLPEQRRELLVRTMFLGASALIIVGPLLFAIVQTSQNSTIQVDVNAESLRSPDLVQYFLPVPHSRVFGAYTLQTMQPYVDADQMTLNEETAVSLPIIGVMLSIVAWFMAGSRARWWAIATFIFMVFSLGPLLRIWGETHFTQYGLPIMLPYALLTELPGLEFMRSPGRFMMVGFVLLAITAGFGLHSLTQRMPRYALVLVGMATMLVLLEHWPQPLPQEILPEGPAFYQTLAQDPEEYGVFDLPLKSSTSMAYNWNAIHYSSTYQFFQMTHNKGIAGGYVSRTYEEHPVFGGVFTDWVDTLQINDQSAVYDSFIVDLAYHNYRYVVLHKNLFGAGESDPGVQRSIEFLNAVFGEQQPLIDNEQIRVYTVDPPEEATTLHWGENWQPLEANGRWADSPASLIVNSPARQPVLLELEPVTIGEDHDVINRHLLTVSVDNEIAITSIITSGQPLTIPLGLATGEQEITLNIQNYRDGNYRSLPFAMHTINLQTFDQFERPADILVDSHTQDSMDASMVALHGHGWYTREADSDSRWGRSPAEVYVYSDVAQEVELQVAPQLVYDGSPTLSNEGSLQIAVNNDQITTQPTDEADGLTLPTQLQAGWNNIKFTSDAGNFAPESFFPGTGDQRTLSFLVQWINIRTIP